MSFVMYVTLQGDDKILIYDLDSETGALDHRREVEVAGGPAPLCTDPEQKYLYCALRGSKELVTFAIEAGSGELTRVGTTPLRSDPCYLSTDWTGRYIFGAYYAAGMCSVHPIGEGGVPQEEGAHYIETAHGAHCIHPDRTNRFVFLPHVVPHNAIHQYLFDVKTGKLTPNDPSKVPGAENQGPRHYAYHPTLNMVYTSNEQGCSASAYRLHPMSGTLAPVQILSTLPTGWEGKNTCAQIHMDPQGRFVYVSNRGHDSIAMYEVGGNGLLTWLGAQPSEQTPRAFNIDPNGRFLYAAGLDSGYIASYTIEETGRLSPLDRYEVGSKPMWVLPVAL